MKTLLNYRKTFFALFVAGILSSTVLLTSCDKEKGDNTPASRMYQISGNANGTSVVPSVTTTATGSITGTYNSSDRNLQYTFNWNGLALAADSVRFYGPAAAGVNVSGNYLYNAAITTPGVTGNSTGSITLTSAQETDLLNGNWYYTISNSTYPSGEIRGQITATVQ